MTVKLVRYKQVEGNNPEDFSFEDYERQSVSARPVNLISLKMHYENVSEKEPISAD
jgi:hypothetical protein